MCTWDNLRPDPWTAICCSPDNPSVYCQKTWYNDCGLSFEEDSIYYYSACPLINQTMCGTESSEMILDAEDQVKDFSWDKLRYSDK